MKIIFTGTGSGKASLKRNHSSFLISTRSYNLLVDAGDGISKALLSARIPFNSINGILLTHLHADHYSGLASLIVQMKMSKRKEQLDVFVHKDISGTVRNFIYQSYLFEEKLNFKLNFIELEENITLPVSEKFGLTFRQNSHLVEYLQFDHSKKLKFPCGSFLFTVNGKNIFYTGDIGGGSDLSLFDDQELHYAISEITHVEMKEIINFYRAAKPKILFLTHISEEIKVKNLIPGKFQGKIIPAYDGLIVTL
ncbi:MAG: MBL fold metallo-hydrolase [Ignavibacteriaceae bacterium]